MTSSTPPPATSNKSTWIATIVCSAITVAGGMYTTHVNNETKAKVEQVRKEAQEALAKTNLEGKKALAKLEEETKLKLSDAADRSRQNMILLQARIDSEKDAQSVRADNCKEMKAIRDSMSQDIGVINGHANYHEHDEALQRLNTNANKYEAYFKNAGYSALRDMAKEKASEDPLERQRDFYHGILSGFNRQIQESCSN